MNTEHLDDYVVFNRKLLILFLEKVEVLSEEERALVFKTISTATHSIFKL